MNAVLSFGLWSTLVLGAVPDPQLKTPYNLRVVLHIAENRFLTPLFREQVERELGELLELTYGPLAKVEIVRNHPLLPEVRARGLERALNGWEDRADRRTHFVLIDYADGWYELQARYFDGQTGLAGPRVRRDRTGDRLLVGQTAARLVDHDFGLSGTVIDSKGDMAKVALRGGDLGVNLDRWIHPGSVFAVTRVRSEAGQERSGEIRWALLQATERANQGVVRCRYYHRRPGDELDVGGETGFRCLLLSTTKGTPLRLRLVDPKTYQPLAGMQVQVHAGLFDKKPPEKLFTNRDGLVVSKASYPNLAVVRILSGSEQLAQVPVALFDEQPVICELQAAPEAEAQGFLETRRDQWLRRVYENVNLANERNRELELLMKQDLMEVALENARNGVQVLKKEMASLAQEKGELGRLADRKPGGTAFTLHDGPERLEDLQKYQGELEALTTRLEHAVQQAERGRRFFQQLERAKLLEKNADFEQALALFDKILVDFDPHPKLKAHVEDLRSGWKLQGEDHAKARQFIYQTWPNLDLVSLRLRLGEAQKALEVCKKAGDRLTPRRLVQAYPKHVEVLQKRLAVLRQATNVDSRLEARAFADMAQNLLNLFNDAQAWIARKEN